MIKIKHHFQGYGGRVWCDLLSPLSSPPFPFSSSSFCRGPQGEETVQAWPSGVQALMASIVPSDGGREGGGEGREEESARAATATLKDLSLCVLMDAAAAAVLSMCVCVFTSSLH